MAAKKEETGRGEARGTYAITNSIRTLRFFAGEMTQQALAEKAGVSRQTIVAIEAGKYSPSLELAFRIAQVFGVRGDGRVRLPSDGRRNGRECMKSWIVVHSYHHGNSEKIARSMAEAIDARVTNAVGADAAEAAEIDLLGLGRGNRQRRALPGTAELRDDTAGGEGTGVFSLLHLRNLQ